MPRLFVAADLPDFVKEQLSVLCSFGLPGVSWVRESQFHLSLRFIGEVDKFGMEAVAGALGEIKSPSFSMRLQGIGSFPQSKPPRVLWAGVEKSDPLNQLQKRVERRLNQAGVPLERRKFHPHVTLGRVKKRDRKIKGLDNFISCHCLFKTKPFTISEYALFSSLLTSKGAIYSKEAIYQLD